MHKEQLIFKNIEIIDFAAEGKSVTRIDNRVVFVHNAIPGDVADVKIIKQKRRYWEAEPVFFHKYSPYRVQPVCKHFGYCGGCKWQHLNYEQQLQFKQQQAEEQIIRIGKVKVPKVLPIVGSSQLYEYRNKLEFTFSNKRWLTPEEMQNPETQMNQPALGFHVAGLFDKIIDIETCYLQAEPSNGIRNFIKNFALQHQFSFFDIRKQEGWLRNLMLRMTTTGQIMVVLIFFYEDEKNRKKICDALIKQFPAIHSLMYVINEKKNASISDLPVQLYFGKPYIVEQFENIQYKISPLSFFQTNSLQALQLYKIIANFADLQSNDVVYDLYTGTGSIANFIAAKTKKVIGIEYVEDAVMDARENSKINNISNTLFFAGDMAKIFTASFIAEHGAPDVIITDPPRSGMHADVVEQINQSGAKRIVYVSCNPATQARDLALLTNYEIECMQPVDMFPHTIHLENVVKLLRK